MLFRNFSYSSHLHLIWIWNLKSIPVLAAWELQFGLTPCKISRVYSAPISAVFWVCNANQFALWSILFSYHDGKKPLCAEIHSSVSPDPKAAASLNLQKVGAATGVHQPQGCPDCIIQMPQAGQWAEERPPKALLHAGHLDACCWTPWVEKKLTQRVRL